MSEPDTLYTPLDVRRFEIRLIELQAGDWDDRVECKLLVRSLLPNAPDSADRVSGTQLPGDEDLRMVHANHPSTPLPQQTLQNKESGPSITPSNGYEAISYVWGPTSDQRCILINGTELAVTSNLYSVLKHLRLTKQARYMWIDAVCINQNDLKERGEQVGLMKRIYWIARRTVVWLGDPLQPDCTFSECEHRLEHERTHASSDSAINQVQCASGSGLIHRYMGFRQSFQPFVADGNIIIDGTGGAFDLLYILGTNEGCLADIQYWCIEALLKAYEKYPAGCAQHASPEQTFERLHALVSPHLETLMKRPWWYRIWTVQESVLPAQVVVACGRSSIHWELIVQAANYYQRHKQCCLGGRQRRWIDSRDEDDIFSRFRKLNRIRYNIQRVSSYPNVRGSQDWTLLASIFSNRLATDDRDKIYGVYGLIDDELADRYPPPTVDYELPTIYLYAIATMRVFDVQQGYEVLSRKAARTLHSTYPSWVIDWSLDDPVISGTKDARPKYTGFWLSGFGFRPAGRYTTAVALYSDLVLSLRGYTIDTISFVSAPMDAAGDTLRSLQPAHLKVWQDAIASTVRIPPFLQKDPSPAPSDWLTLSTIPYNKRDTYHTAFLRTIVIDRGSYDDRVTSQDLLELEAWYFHAPRHLLGRTWGYGRMPPTLRAGHKLLVTRAGKIGMVRHDAQPGDVVVVVEGGEMPMILRPQNMLAPGRRMGAIAERLVRRHGLRMARDRRLGQSLYEYVGQCYLHGFMDVGDAFYDGDVDDILLI